MKEAFLTHSHLFKAVFCSYLSRKLTLNAEMFYFMNSLVTLSVMCPVTSLGTRLAQYGASQVYTRPQTYSSALYNKGDTSIDKWIIN